MSLSAKETRFVLEYVVDLNATQAAIRAGYSERSASSIAERLMRKDEIAAAVARVTSQHLQKCAITSEAVLEEIRRLGFSDIRKLFDADGRLLPCSEWPEEAASAVAAIEVFEEFGWTGAEKTLIGFTKKVKLWDKGAALKLMAQYLKLLVEVSRVEGEVLHTHRFENASDEELREKALALRDRARLRLVSNA